MIGLGLRLWLGSGRGVSYAAESSAIFAAFTTPPTTARKALIDACVVSLKTAGVWAKLDALYMFAAADSQAGLINWKNPGTYNGTAVNSPTFTADHGFVGNGTSSYVDLNYNPGTAGGHLSQDSASAGIWSLTNSAADCSDLGGSDGSAQILFQINWSDGKFYSDITNNIDSATVVADSLGHNVLSRTASGSYAKYKAGSSIATISSASIGVPNSDMLVGAKKASGGGAIQFSSRQYAAAHLGGGLTAGEVASLYAAQHTYLQAVAGVA